MSHVFIAYHYADVERAAALQAAVEAAGYASWLDPNPQAGATWWPGIDDALERAFALVVLLTDESVASPFTAYEWATALAHGVPVIPVVAGAPEPHPRLAALDPVPLAEGLPGDLLARLDPLAAALGAAHMQAVGDASEPVVAAVAVLSRANPAGHPNAVSALVRSSDPAARAALLRAVTHPIFPGVRRLAIRAVSATADDAAIDALLGALGDDDLDVQHEAAAALGAIGPAAIAGLTRALRSPNRDVQRRAVWALALIRSPESVPALVEALAIPDWNVSRTAALALGRLGDPRALPGLRAACEGEDPHLRRLAAEALEAIGGQHP